MTVGQALDQLFELEEEHQKKVIADDTYVVGVARVGQKDQKINKVHIVTSIKRGLEWRILTSGEVISVEK